MMKWGRILVFALVMALLCACSTAAPEATQGEPPHDASSGDTWVRPADGAAMVFVPAGQFPYGPGSTTDPPTRTFYLDAFWIDRTEVTNAQYARCVAAAACLEPLFPEPYKDPARTDHPIVAISYGEAEAYCNWVGGRLPKEIEWEKAARGTDGRVYPWGDTFDPARVNYQFSGIAGTEPVGSHPENASPYGALDMSGNACEWVEERWRTPEEYLADPTSTRYRGRHPVGHHITLRGGSWAALQTSVATYSRTNEEPVWRAKHIGFRCVMSHPEGP